MRQYPDDYNLRRWTSLLTLNMEYHLLYVITLLTLLHPNSSALWNESLDYNYDYYYDYDVDYQMGESSRSESEAIQLDTLLLGSVYGQGIVGIRFNGGSWGGICFDSFDHDDAKVVCRTFGFSTNFGLAVHPSVYGPYTSLRVRYNMYRLQCKGGETSLLNCSYSRTGSCSQRRLPAAVICSTETLDARLVAGGTVHGGRLEVKVNNQWGTVCNDVFADTPQAAFVVCHQFSYPTSYVTPYTFNYGDGHIWLDDVNCTGKENSIWECEMGIIGTHDCTHIEDIGVICSNYYCENCMNGECILDSGIYACNCAPGWSGVECSVVDGSVSGMSRTDLIILISSVCGFFVLVFLAVIILRIAYVKRLRARKREAQYMSFLDKEDRYSDCYEHLRHRSSYETSQHSSVYVTPNEVTREDTDVEQPEPEEESRETIQSNIKRLLTLDLSATTPNNDASDYITILDSMAAPRFSRSLPKNLDKIQELKKDQTGTEISGYVRQSGRKEFELDYDYYMNVGSVREPRYVNTCRLSSPVSKSDFVYMNQLSLIRKSVVNRRVSQ